MKRQPCCIECNGRIPFSLLRLESEELKVFVRKRNICLLPVVAFSVMWVRLVGMAYSDEIKMVDGTVLEGEIIKVDGELISLRRRDGSVSGLQMKDVTLISRGNEISIISRQGEKLSVLRIPKSENFSMNDVVWIKKDTLTLQDLGTETTNVAAKVGTPEAKNDAAQPSVAIDEKNAPAETKTVTAPPKTWKGHIDAGLTAKDGNTESTTANLKGGYANERECDNIYFDAIALYEIVTNRDTNVDEVTVNEQRATGKYEYKHTPRFYSFFNQYLEHDEIESLNYRSISSPGVGYRFLDSERLKYKAEAGPAYTLERFHGGITEDSLGVRVGQRLDWQFWRDTKFYAKSEFVESAEDTNDWRVYSGLGLRHNLTKSIAVSFEYLDQYNNMPAEGKMKEDRTFIGSVGYNF
ncbi:hypothetical protein BIY37_02890 [Candidatus Brocadia sapporoensis]|uniref:DUF481 domain-containing protein n=1 Tax=Candidatus Brocadia sapporoensis TaxID=392547 RepID=A0A1V6M2C2_9BACT|nr:hypothetical protein BIY37_02890 [Candidatus Brocadia sapporoensis]